MQQVDGRAIALAGGGLELLATEDVDAAAVVRLVYRQTVISGVQPIERWDYFECRTCGAFVYRERPRKLRSAT